MARSTLQFEIETISRPIWDEMLQNSPQDLVIDQDTLYLGLEEMTFNDFCEQVRMEMSWQREKE